MAGYCAPRPLLLITQYWLLLEPLVAITLKYMYVISLQYCYLISGQPDITFITNTTVLFEGSKVILTCNVTNDPDAVANSLQVYWYNPKGLQLKIDTNDGILVYNSTDRNTGQVQSVLVFDSVNRSKTGTYTCRAYNDPESYSEENITLTVECE